MKFYISINSSTCDYLNKIINNILTAIISNKSSYVEFFKNGVLHNIKNAAIIYNNQYKNFISNNKRYGSEKDFTKESWRKFVKLQVFL